jgi:hypothetical protein
MSAASDHVIAEHTVAAWCMGMSDSVKNADINAHMENISRRVKVYGNPSKEAIEYRDWKARRKYEFANSETLSLTYQNVRLISSTQRRIRFSTTETTVGKNGRMLVLTKNIILEREDEMHWRVVEEHITNWQMKNIDLGKY